jgi:hypothetical protein
MSCFVSKVRAVASREEEEEEEEEEDFVYSAFWVS